MFNFVAGSDFSRVDGSAALPEFAMRPLQEDPRLRLRYLEPTPVITPGPARRGALVPSGPRVCADSFPHQRPADADCAVRRRVDHIDQAQHDVRRSDPGAEVSDQR